MTECDVCGAANVPITQTPVLHPMLATRVTLMDMCDGCLHAVRSRLEPATLWFHQKAKAQFELNERIYRL